MLWEALLALQPGFGNDGPGRPALEQLVQRRVAGADASTEQVAKGKRIIDTDTGFTMEKVCSLFA